MSSHFEIYNSNQENIAVPEGKGNIWVKTGRTVLEEINPTATRIQPSRAAKNAGKLKVVQADKEHCQVYKENFKVEKESMLDDKKPAKYDQENCQTDNENVHGDKENDQEYDSIFQENNDQELNESCISLSSELNDVPMMMDETCMEDNTKDTDYLTSPEYANDVYLYLRQIENKNKPKWNYMSKQTEVTHSMRSILIDWLVEVATEYKLQPETLHLTISYVDRFMSVMSVQRSKLQLVGVTSMLIAAKVEEVYPPNISDFIYITDDSFTKKQILRMEILLLKVLSFDLSMPTSHLFVNKYCHMFELHQRCVSLATYVNDLSLLDGETFLRFSPSILAASSVALARHTLGDQAWTEEMVSTTGYDISDLKHCFLSLQQAFKEADMHPQQSIQSKYRSFSFHNVADITPRDIYT